MGTFTIPEMEAHIERLEAKLESAEHADILGDDDAREAIPQIRRLLTRFRVMLAAERSYERRSRR